TRRREFTQSYEGKKKLSVSFSLNDSAGGRNQQYSQLSAPPSRESSVEPAYNAEDKGVQLLEVLRYFALTPAIWLLCSAAMIRQAAGLIWAYNSKDFFSDVRDQSNYQQSVFMLWIPALFGCLGSVYGGYVSDNYVKHASNSKRLIILVVCNTYILFMLLLLLLLMMMTMPKASNLCAAPFVFGALLTPCPWCYLWLIPSNIIGEMWSGIGMAVAVELVPAKMKTTGLAVYFFVIGLSGFFPALVTPISNLFDSGENGQYLRALIVLFPGFYLLSSLLFFLTFFIVIQIFTIFQIMPTYFISHHACLL
ncbi:hypothetical protein RFI_16844, partial [Reticulomyxa filosa]